MTTYYTIFFFFFFNDTATTEIYTPLYTLSLHDALPTSALRRAWRAYRGACRCRVCSRRSEEHTSELQSHSGISYAVFCLKKKNARDERPVPCRRSCVQCKRAFLKLFRWMLRRRPRSAHVRSFFS